MSVTPASWDRLRRMPSSASSQCRSTRAFVGLRGPEVGLVRGEEGTGAVGGLWLGQILPDADGGRERCLQHRDAPVEEPHRSRERAAGALQVGGGQDIGDLLDRSGLEPPAAHAIGLDGSPAAVVVVERPRRGGRGSHAAGEDADLLGLPGVVGAAERDRHGEALRVAGELADHWLPFTGCAEHACR